MNPHGGSLRLRTARALGDPVLRPGSMIAGQYRIEHLLGRGGMGEVFAAVHVRTGRAVAIKWMLPTGNASGDSVRRFLAEARITARVEHPNVVQVFDCGEHLGAPFLVMERLRGESLRERLDREGRLTSGEVTRLMLPVMRGVAEAHREGVLHRDLKPDNVFLCRGKDGSEREPKVVDFGIGKLRDDGGRANITRAGMVVGTPAYMAPEQLAGSRVPDPRVDVYALGVVMYEALAGRCPFRAEGTFALIAQIATSTPPPLVSFAPHAPPPLLALVERAMHRDPDQRFPSVAAMIASVEHADVAPVASSTTLDPSRARSRAVPATVVMQVDPESATPVRSSSPRVRLALAALVLGAIAAVVGSTALGERSLGAPAVSIRVRDVPSERVSVAVIADEPAEPPLPIALHDPDEAEPIEDAPAALFEPALARPARARSRAAETAARRTELGTNGALILE